ncbi:diphthine--ammonia ligase [Candidatus Hecatella orcuttiae]|jgi:ABC transporter with metal-binding/Fe-S-binding domain ATP-binding protein|uniref:diphthine--ammonia ligase n=1 Tax=Candidatus Hecatella orcuttiae TaxID=1935119 RepID=UPI0028683A26|nr:diphthine--ammonia ligase [Candidatus Hecatella orcuttiae]
MVAVKPLKVAVLFSGGKDSTLAVLKTVSLGHRVSALLTVKPANPESWMFHHPCIDLTPLQSQAMGLPLHIQATSGRKEEELQDLRRALEFLKKKYRIEAVASGAVESQYQKSRIEKICKETGLISLNPLWGRDPLKLLEEVLSLGFEIVFTAVAAEGFDESWLNRRLDEEAVRDLKILNKKFGVHPSLEGGEGETFVKDTPFFARKVEFCGVEKVWRGYWGYLKVKEAKLIDKSGKRRAAIA